MNRLPRTILCALLFLLQGRAAGSPDMIRVEICEEGVPKDHTWPVQPALTEQYTEEVFGLFELPQKYISTGVRANRAFPTLVRATAKVTLPAGKHRLLLRSRGRARLWVNGIVVWKIPSSKRSSMSGRLTGFCP